MPVLISFLVWPPLEPWSPSLASLTARLPSARAPRDWGAAVSKPQVACLSLVALGALYSPESLSGDYLEQGGQGGFVLQCPL